MDALIRADVLKRLDYILGHLEGIRHMVEVDRACSHILRQTYAVRRAIRKIETILVDNYLRTGLAAAASRGPEEAVGLRELVGLYRRPPRRNGGPPNASAADRDTPRPAGLTEEVY